MKIPFYSRPHLLHCLPLLHCRVPHCCNAHEWVEAGQEVWDCPHVLVSHLYGVCQPLRTQCFRILQSPRVWEQLLGGWEWYYVIYNIIAGGGGFCPFLFYLVLHSGGLKIKISCHNKSWILKSSYPDFFFPLSRRNQTSYFIWILIFLFFKITWKRA